MDVVKIKKGHKEDLVLTIVDRFTKYVVFALIKDEKAPTIAKALLNNLVCQWGPPEILISDNAKSFKVAEIMKNLYALLGIEKKYCAPYHPEGNGSAERFNKILLDLLSKLVDERPKTWKTKLPALSLAVNSAVNRSTGYSAYKLMTGREMTELDNIIFDIRNTQYYQSEDHLVCSTYHELKKIFEIAADNLELNHELQKKTYDRNKTCVELKVNDRVLLHRPVNTQNEYYKLSSCWIGPYLITRNINDHNFHLRDEETGSFRIAHRNQLRKIPDNMRGALSQEKGNVKYLDAKASGESSKSENNDVISSSGTEETDSDDYVERYDDSPDGVKLQSGIQSSTNLTKTKDPVVKSRDDTNTGHFYQNEIVKEQGMYNSEQKGIRYVISQMITASPSSSGEATKQQNDTSQNDIIHDDAQDGAWGSPNALLPSNEGTSEGRSGPLQGGNQSLNSDEAMTAGGSMEHIFKRPRFTENLPTPTFQMKSKRKYSGKIKRNL